MLHAIAMGLIISILENIYVLYHGCSGDFRWGSTVLLHQMVMTILVIVLFFNTLH